MGVPTLLLPKKIDWELILRELEKHGITHIFLAGFMKIVPENFLRKWRGAIVNVHPSLLPKYAGLNSSDRAFRDKEDLGVTIHSVIPEVDAGDKIVQSNVGKAKSLNQAEFIVHLKEQQLGRRVVEKWRSI